MPFPIGGHNERGLGITRHIVGARRDISYRTSAQLTVSKLRRVKHVSSVVSLQGQKSTEANTEMIAPCGDRSLLCSADVRSGRPTHRTD